MRFLQYFGLFRNLRDKKYMIEEKIEILEYEFRHHNLSSFSCVICFRLVRLRKKISRLKIKLVKLEYFL
jgi:hypothetical protein